MSQVITISQSQAQQPAPRAVVPYDAPSFVALPLPHCNEVGLYADRQLLGLLSRRAALDLAATLIKSSDLLLTGAGQRREVLTRFDHEFGTPTAVLDESGFGAGLAIANLESPIGPTNYKGDHA